MTAFRRPTPRDGDTVSHSLAVFVDLDDTLVSTESLKELRQNRMWNQVFSRISETQVYEDTYEFIARAKAVASVGIVTSSPKSYARKIVSYHNLEVPVVVAYHDTANHKPHPDPYNLAAERIGVKSRPLCSVVGNSIDDLLSATRAYMISFGVDRHLKGVTIDSETPSIWCDSLLRVAQLLELFSQMWSLRFSDDQLMHNYEGKISVFSVIPYVPKRSGGGPATDFLLEVKEHRIDRSFVAAALLAPVALLAWRQFGEQKIILGAVPTSSAGSRNRSCELIAELLSKRFPKQFSRIPGLLIRTKGVSKSSFDSSARDFATQYETIGVDERVNIRGAKIAIIDDIVTSGNHMMACASRLYEAGADLVFGLSVARTSYRTQEAQDDN